jgi:hypothetical protein
MTQLTDRAARFRVSVSAEATQRELRMCGFALLNQYLAMHLVIAEHLELNPIELLILIATTTGNVQRAVRPDALPEVLRGSTPLPQELIEPSRGSPEFRRRPYAGMWTAWSGAASCCPCPGACGPSPDWPTARR